MWYSRSGAIAVLCTLALAACDGGGGGDAAVSRDSAGVRIVGNDRGTWTERTAWTVEEQPVFEVGLQRDVNYLLDRVPDAARLSDGRVVIANSGSGELRFYDARSKFLRKVGRKGDGPGEFRGLALVRRIRGDSLVAYDGAGGRVSSFDPQGKFVRSLETRDPLSPPYRLVDVFNDGALLLYRSEKRFNSLPRSSVTRDTLTLLRRDPARETLDSLATFPGRESVLQIQMNNGQIQNVKVTNYPFMKETMVVAGGDAFYVGLNEAFSIERRREDGTLERVIRRAHESEPVRGAYLDSLKSVEGATFEGVPIPDALPAFGALKVDEGGNLWVQSFPYPGSPPKRWEVFDPSGKLLGAVTLPPRFVPTQIGDDFVLGVARTDDDVEVVRMYRLRKP